MGLLEAAIKDLEMVGDCRTCGNRDPFCESNPDSCIGYKWRGAANDINPLTLDELRGMDGKPVWVVGVSCINHFRGHWDICEWENGEMVIFPHCMESPDIMLFGKTWFAYRRKPEE